MAEFSETSRGAGFLKLKGNLGVAAIRLVIPDGLLDQRVGINSFEVNGRSLITETMERNSCFEFMVLVKTGLLMRFCNEVLWP